MPGLDPNVYPGLANPELPPEAMATGGPVTVPVAASEPAQGLVEPGNIDLNNRPIHQNPDGSISTVRSMSFQDEVNGPEILVPTIADDGTPLSDTQAIDLYRKTGKHLGKFSNPDIATAYAQHLHEQQAKQYLPQSGKPQTPEELAQQNVTDTQALGRENVAIAKDNAQLQDQQAQERARFDAEHAQKLEKFQADQLTARQAADAEVAAKRHALDQAPFHSLWATRSAGQKATIALGLLLGGLSWNSNHQNRAIQLLSDAEQEDLQLQKEQHQALWQDLQLSLENKKDLSTDQLHELSDWQAQEAAKWSAVASRLNAAIAQNRGRADTSTAQAAAIEATEKANTAHINAINAKATANHLTAQTTLAEEEAKTQPSIRAKNYAEAEQARSAAKLGIPTKFEHQLMLRVPAMLDRDPDVKLLKSKGGPLQRIEQAESIKDSLIAASNTGDPGALAAAVAGAREQVTRILTGAAPTKSTAALVEALQGTPGEVESKLSRIFGDPKVSTQFRNEIYRLADDASEQARRETDAIRERVQKRNKDSRNPMRKSKAVSDFIDEQVDSLTGSVKNGGGTPRYPEGGATPGQQARPAATPAQPQYPVGTRATSGGKPIIWDGKQWNPA